MTAFGVGCRSVLGDVMTAHGSLLQQALTGQLCQSPAKSTNISLFSEKNLCKCDRHVVWFCLSNLFIGNIIWHWQSSRLNSPKKSVAIVIILDSQNLLRVGITNMVKEILIWKRHPRIFTWEIRVVQELCGANGRFDSMEYAWRFSVVLCFF